MGTCPGHFMDELVLEILCLLPLKSQARFRSVSKQWRSLISIDPSPVRALLVDCQKDMHLLLLDTCNHQSSFPFHEPRFLLLQSCNGLLLLGSRPQYSREYRVYNLLTRQRATLPLCLCCFHSEHEHLHVTASLAYEPSRSPHYKLLCLCLYCIMIYSSLTSSWTCRANSSFEPRLKAIVHSYHYTKSPLYWNGSVYYISDHPPKDDSYKLYRFDLDREAMLRTKLPYHDFETSCVKLLVESWGRLYLRFCHSGNDLKIRLCGRKTFRVRSDRYKVFLPAAEIGGEDEMWLVVLDGMLVYRYGLGSKSVGLVRGVHHGYCRGCNPYWGIKVHEFAESILELPQPLH